MQSLRDFCASAWCLCRIPQRTLFGFRSGNLSMDSAAYGQASNRALQRVYSRVIETSGERSRSDMVPIIELLRELARKIHCAMQARGLRSKSLKAGYARALYLPCSMYCVLCVQTAIAHACSTQHTAHITQMPSFQNKSRTNPLLCTCSKVLHRIDRGW